jgi:hypothetical protein
MSSKNRELKKEYKQTHRPMGVFQIRIIVNEKVLVGVARDLPGILNRHRFELKTGGPPNKSLQEEWNRFGEDNFAFEILDELQPGVEPGHDHRPDLLFLEDLWLEKLMPYGERGYNDKKEEQIESGARGRAIPAGRI